MITLQHTEEMLSMAAINAVAAMAGVELATAGVHDYGIDGTIREMIDSPVGKVPSLSIDYQLKATINWEQTNGYIIYDLNVQNYNKMIVRLQDSFNTTPFILVLLCLPRDESEWLDICPESTILKKCCYWYRVPNENTISNNSSTFRIKIPEENVLLPETIQEIFSQWRCNCES